MEDTMVSREVASDIHEGSLVFRKSCIRVLRYLNLASISMFMFSIVGWGLVCLPMVMLGLGSLEAPY
jgi:hypothetical protein